MTYEEALEKRNEAREIRNNAKEELDGLSEMSMVKRMLDAEYNWGYWDAVITIMKEHKLKRVTA